MGNTINLTFRVALVLGWLLAAGSRLPAEEPGSHREIETVIHEFNSAVARNDLKKIGALFTPNGTYREGSMPALPVAQALQQIPPKRLPWDERMPLQISIQSIGLLRPDIAIVQATQSDASPMGDTRRWACRFVLVHRGAGWKISSFSSNAIP